MGSQEQYDYNDSECLCIDNHAKLILYNDNYNTFEFVIRCLIEICDYDYDRAEQVSVIVHYKGHCIIKAGDYEELLVMYEKLTLRGLTVELQA